MRSVFLLPVIAVAAVQTGLCHSELCQRFSKDGHLVLRPLDGLRQLWHWPQLWQSPPHPFRCRRKTANTPKTISPSRRMLCAFIGFYTSPKISPRHRTRNATTQAMAHWVRTVKAAALVLPISCLTVEMAATQGVYSRVNTRNTTAV